MSEDEARRRWALEQAVTLAAHQQVSKYSAEIVVNVAEVFEKYARGEQS